MNLLSPRRLPLLLLLGALALAALAAAGVAALALADGKADAAPASRSVRAEIMLNAERARWRPSGGGKGILVLEDVDPRMAVMAVAPRRQTAVVPSSLLAANWQQLFAKTKNETNIIVAVEHEGRRKLIPFRARLFSGHPSGRLRLAVTPLRQGAHELDTLGSKPASFESVSVLVDPEITDAIKALWDALVSFFTGKSYELPPNPTIEKDGREYFVDGFDPLNEKDATYKGPTSGDITSPEDRERVQYEVADAVGNIMKRVFDDGDLGWNLFAGGTYDGLALFDDTPGVFIAGEPDSRTKVTNSAIYEMDLKKLEVTSADVAALNLRGTSAEQVTIENSAFDVVDVTGATLGSDTARSSVSNSVFERLSANEPTRSPLSDNKSDGWDGLPTEILNVDFKSVSFREAKLQKAHIDGTTFQGCGLVGADFSNAFITGAEAGPGETFQPTFNDSILEKAKFDGAVLRNASFRDADFSGGASFAAATLNNADFTFATGLQDVDWSNLNFDGPVYGLGAIARTLDIPQEQRAFIRSLTFNGQRPGYDTATGFDVDPKGYLIDPATGVRLDRQWDGKLVPFDPTTELSLKGPLTGNELVYDVASQRLYDPAFPEATNYQVEYASGRLIER